MHLSEQPITNSHVRVMFKEKYSKKRLEFMHKTCFLNGWSDWEDYNICMKKYRPNFEKLYKIYCIIGIVPYFNKLIISFVRDIDEFIELNKSIMYVVCEDLMFNWQI